MIIEIKGLPEGQKIQHINVDVTFAPGGEPIIRTRTTPEPKKAPTQSTSGPSEDRETKEVPPEMLEAEF